MIIVKLTFVFILINLNVNVIKCDKWWMDEVYMNESVWCFDC